MKPIVRVVLAGSLALNAGFVALIFLGPATPTTPSPPPVASEMKAANSAPTIDANVWPGLATTELQVLISRLRHAGFPPDVVRAILTAQVREHYSARRKALDPAGDGRPFWKDPTFDPKAQSALRKIAREEQAALRELLGADAEPTDPMRDLYQNRSFTFLSPEKAVDVRQILREFDERRADLFTAGYNPMTDRAKMAAIDKEQLAAVAQLLTPAELLEYNLRTSNTANSLRDQLSAFNPTEDEFRALYQLREPFDERFGQNFGLTQTPDQMRQRSEAEKMLNDQFKASLTADRAAEYDRATDYNYRRTSQLVARLDLPKETTDRVWQVQRDFEQRRNDLYRSGTNEGRTQQLLALQQEAVAAITPLIGERNLEAYKQYGGGWLQSFAPRPAPPK